MWGVRFEKGDEFFSFVKRRSTHPSLTVPPHINKAYSGQPHVTLKFRPIAGSDNMAGGGTVNVLLKKVLVSVAPERVRLASFTERCRLIGVLQDDRTLALWDIDERWQAELTDVQT